MWSISYIYLSKYLFVASNNNFLLVTFFALQNSHNLQVPHNRYFAKFLSYEFPQEALF